MSDIVFSIRNEFFLAFVSGCLFTCVAGFLWIFTHRPHKNNYLDLLSRFQSKAGFGLDQELVTSQAIVALSPLCTLVTDTSLKIISANPAAEKTFGYSESDLLGRHLSELRHDAEEKHDWALDVDGTNFDHMMRHRDGSSIPVRLSVTAFQTSSSKPGAYVVIAHDLSEHRRAEEAMQLQAFRDPLTGLPNRTLLRDRVEVAIERARRCNNLMAVVFVDLDHFKNVNDSLGHQAGDELLLEISRRLNSCVRKSDTVARVGGDEFIILLCDLKRDADAEIIARKLRDEISRTIRIAQHSLTITASIGVSLFPESQEAEMLFKHADLAMYSAKSAGRNGVVSYTPGLGAASLKKLTMELALRECLHNNALEIVYQPQIGLASGEWLGVEALLRWNSVEFGPVSPADFIPIAEETGLMVPLGEWVLRHACLQIAELQLVLGRRLSVSVNVSSRQFHNGDFSRTVASALAASGLEPAQLELEVTEKLLMLDSQDSLETIRELRLLGVRFSIDDFGTGFFNIADMTRFAVARIKVDRSFVDRCDTEAHSRAIVTAIIALAHSLAIEVLAEGVETEAHRELLLSMKCDSAQGYFYSQPLTLDYLREFASKATVTSAGMVVNATLALSTSLKSDISLLAL